MKTKTVRNVLPYVVPAIFEGRPPNGPLLVQVFVIK